IADAIGLTPQLAVQAFQFGDGFTNLISPLLGWTVGSVTMAGLSFDKWLKWVLPIVIIFLLLSFIFMYILTGMGWTGI
ncbi:MAG: YfcC family protein, partial [Neofamilia sp.]